MKYGPGKFEGNGNYSLVAQYLYSLSLDNSLDDDLGESESFGWYGKFSGKIKGRGPFYVIVSENSQGFFDATYYDTSKELEEDWTKLEEDWEKFSEEQEEEESSAK